MAKTTRDRRRDNAAMELFKVTCQYGGVMELGKAVQSLSRQSKGEVQRHGAAKFIEQRFSKIFKVKRDQSRTELEVVFPFVFCQEAAKGNCPNGQRCTKLHLCPHYVKGSCMFKAKCRLSHDKRDQHTLSILRAIQLDDVDDGLWDVLLEKILADTEIERGASTHTLPDICKHYNNQGGCTKKEKCPFLHVCKHFVDDECKFGDGCKRIHDLTQDSHNLEVFKKFRLGRCSLQQLLSLLRGRKRTSSSSSDSSLQADSHRPLSLISKPFNLPINYGVSPNKLQFTQAPSASSASSALANKQDLEICGFYLKGKCNYGDKCINLHRDVPYQWQYQEISPNSNNWQDFPEDTNIMAEHQYCNLDSILKCFINQHAYQISFDKMIAEPSAKQSKLKLRRVSTQSSEVAPPGHIFSTQFKWYWKDENDEWKSYDSPDPGVAVNTTCSKSLEKDYLQGKDSHSFSAGHHTYILYFDKMFQRNTKFLTERNVTRRPEFVAKDQMKEIAQKRTDALKLMFKSKSASASSISASDTCLPPHWSSMEDRDFCLESLSVTSQEFKDAETRFQSTMTSPKTIVKIERIQNPDLWIPYAQKKARMQSKAGANPLQERPQLFHGTSADISDAICQQGFDWRMCGKHGTLYGKGSYFACQANYSHRYTDQNPGGLRYMFIARVLVGAYAVGSGTLTRPPPKDPSKPFGELFDSCVNDETNPSIFVIFENSQAYPEHLITYK